MRRTDAITAAILAEADAARLGALAMRVPERDVEDVVQDTLLAVWLRGRAGGINDPTDRAAVRMYIYVTAKNAAVARWRAISRAELPGVLPEPAADPVARLEARDELRTLPRPAYLRAIVECLAAGSTLHAMADALGIPPGTLATRLRRLRTAPR